MSLLFVLSLYPLPIIYILPTLHLPKCHSICLFILLQHTLFIHYLKLCVNLNQLNHYYLK